MPGVHIEGVLDSKLGITNGFRRYDDGKHRFYYRLNDGKPEVLAGITTIIKGVYPTSKYLIDFIVENPDTGWISARYGSLFHHLVEVFLKGGRWFEELPSPESPDYRKLRKEMVSFKRFAETFKIRPRLVEVPLLGNIRGCKYVTTVDLVLDVEFQIPLPKKRNQEREYERKVETWIIDMKSNYLEKLRKTFLHDVHLPQLIAQKVAVEQTFGIKVDRIFNWAATAWTEDNGDNTYTLVEWTREKEKTPLWNRKGYKQADVDAFYSLMAVAKKRGLNVPKGSFEFFDDFSLDTRPGKSIYRKMTYAAWVKNALSVPKTKG